MPWTSVNESSPDISQHQFLSAQSTSLTTSLSLSLAASQIQENMEEYINDEYIKDENIEDEYIKQEYIEDEYIDRIAPALPSDSITPSSTSAICCVKTCMTVCAIYEKWCAIHQKYFDNAKLRKKMLNEEGRCVICSAPIDRLNEATTDTHCENCYQKTLASRQRSREKKQTGLCRSCGKPNGGFLMCEECRNDQKRTYKARVERAVQVGVCKTCFKPAERLKTCNECANTIRLKSKAKRERAQAGECWKCFKPSGKFKTCETCRSVQQGQLKARREMAQAGECWKCLRPSGKFKTCEICRDLDRRQRKAWRDRKRSQAVTNHCDKMDEDSDDEKYSDKPDI